MKIRTISGVLLLIGMLIGFVSGTTFTIAPEVLYKDMPVTITYTGLSDSNWTIIGFEDRCTATGPTLQGIANASLTLPFDLYQGSYITLDGGMSGNYNFSSETQNTTSSISAGTFLFNSKRSGSVSGSAVNVSYMVRGYKIGPDAGTITLVPHFDPPNGTLRVLVADYNASRFITKDIPYWQEIPAPSVTAGDVTVESGDTREGELTISSLANGLSLFNVTLALEDTSVGVFTNAVLSGGFVATQLDVDKGTITVNATSSSITGKVTDLPVLAFTCEGRDPGTSTIVVTVNEVRDKDGTHLSPVQGYNGLLTVTPPPVPGVDFVGTPPRGIVPFNVTFRYLPSDHPDSYDWNFGDSSGNSTEAGPVHTYSQAGNFDVGLTVAGSAGSNSTLKPGYIQAKQVPLWFMGNATSGTAPLEVRFTGLSSGTVTNWVYYFGDRTTGSGPDTTHIYTAPGTYTVHAIADIGGVRNSAIRYNYITVS